MKHTISSDADKTDLIAQYQAGITRLDEIINSPLNTNTLVIAAIKDEARILRRLAVILKKVVMNELG